MSTASDKVPVLCPSCDKRLLVPAGTLGKQGRCPVCQTVFTLEQLFDAEPVAQPTTYDASFSSAPSSWSAPPPATNSFEQSYGGDDYQLQAAPAATTNFDPYASPQVSSAPMTYATSAPAKPKGSFWDSSMLGGIAMMVIAVVWFFGALLLIDRIFFYPPILFIIGLVTMIKGLLGGNLAGE